jgi:hypothetical protein
MGVALLAAFSLAVANVCSVIMVQAEARGRPVVAGLAEVAYWGANILTIKFAVTHFTVWLVLFCLVSAYLSTYFATKHGHESIEDPIDLRQDEELAELEARVETLEGEQ